MNGIRILTPGLYTSIQDAGRFGYRKYGMPLSGVMDNFSSRIANWLVGNHPDEAVLETTLIGPEIEFLSKAVFAVTGADAPMHLNDKKVAHWSTLFAKKGDILKIDYAERGTRHYISFAGGLRINNTMGSKSTHSRSLTGGITGKELEKGDQIPLYPGLPVLFKKRLLKEELRPRLSNNIALRITRGIDYESFSKISRDLFLSNNYEVSSYSDRMGLRLEGESLNHIVSADVITYAIDYGTIQVPGDGLPIIMGADCQTTGGYKQISRVISADLSLIGQLKPGDKISFLLTGLEEAVKLYQEKEIFINSIISKGKANVCTDCFEKR